MKHMHDDKGWIDGARARWRVDGAHRSVPTGKAITRAEPDAAALHRQGFERGGDPRPCQEARRGMARQSRRRVMGDVVAFPGVILIERETNSEPAESPAPAVTSTPCPVCSYPISSDEFD